MVADAPRRLAFHGMVLFLGGLLVGAVVPSFTTPRLGLSAHTGSILNGTFLMALAAVWSTVRLPAAAARAAFWLMVAGSYGASGGLVLAAAFGTSRSTPLHGAGHVGTAWQETLVEAVLTVSAVAVLIATVALLLGLRRSARG